MEKDFNKLNEKILEKLENKIAIAEFQEKEAVKTVKKSKVKSYIGAKVASIVAIVGLVSGNVYTFATYQKDLFSVILEKVGIFEAYEEEKIEVNLIKENENASLTLVDYAIDGDTLIVGYNLKLKKENEMLVKMVHDTVTLTCGEEELNLTDESDEGGKETYKDFGLFEEISKTEYSIYRFYTLDPTKLTNEMTLKSSVKLYDYDKEEYYNPTEGEPEMREFGTWDFTVKINKDELEKTYKEYYVEDKNDYFERVEDSDKTVINLPEVKLLSVKKSDILTRFKFVLKGYSTNVVYFVEILDSKGNIILEKDVQYIVGGVETEIITGKIPDNEKITINVYEMAPGAGFEVFIPSDTIYSKATLEVDMANDLMEEKKTEGIKRSWKGIEFEYDVYASEHEATYEEIYDDFVRSEMYISLFENEVENKYSHDWDDDNQINISRYTNLNSKDLDSIVSDLQLLETVGGYKYNPNKTYTIYLKDSSIMPDNLRAQDITLGKILELAKGNSITVQGVTVTQPDIDINQTKFVNQEETEIDGIKAITWVQEYGMFKYENEWAGQYKVSEGKMQRKYVFISDGFIYEITCPEGIENQEIVENFVNNIKIK